MFASQMAWSRHSLPLYPYLGIQEYRNMFLLAYSKVRLTCLAYVLCKHRFSNATQWAPFAADVVLLRGYCHLMHSVYSCTLANMDFVDIRRHYMAKRIPSSVRGQWSAIQRKGQLECRFLLSTGK